MDQHTQVELIRRVLAHVRDGGTDRGQGERTYPWADYRDQGRYDAEMAATIGRMPLILAPASRLSRPGDYVTASVLGVPVAVVRGPDGGLSSFVNVCRHRAAQLLTAEHGTGLRAIVCPYHAWSYDLTGNLTTIPDGEGSFPATATGPLGLVRLPVTERHGMIWGSAAPAAGESTDVSRFLGPLDDELASFGFGGYSFYSAQARSWNFNWKTGMEAFLENYHFATLHKRSTSKVFLNNLTILDNFSPHIRAVAPKRSITGLAEAAEETWELGPHATLLYVIFPNTCLFVEKAHASLLQIFPDGPARSQVVITHIVGRDGLRYREFWDKNIALFMKAVTEDLDMCESMTAGMAALPDGEIIFGRNEAGCVAFREAVDTALALHAVGTEPRRHRDEVSARAGGR